MTAPKPPKSTHGRLQKVVLGWSEPVEFLDWRVKVRAKVDTGARTSALHVENLEQIAPDRVRFDVVLDRNKLHRRVHVEAPVLKWARVRSSTGHFTRRCFVRTTVRIAGVEKQIDLSLVSREKMIFRMLIGRTALERDFVVDVSLHHEAKEEARKAKKKK